VNVSLKLLHNSTQKFTTNLYQWDACGRGFPDNIVPLSLPVLVVSSSVSSAIRFLFSDLTCFMKSGSAK